MGSRTNGFVYIPVYITLFPNETSSPYFLVRRFFIVAFDLASSRGIPASNIGWNWMEWQRGQRVSVWQRFKGASHAFVDPKQDPATPLPLALLFDIQLNREASVFTRGWKLWIKRAISSIHGVNRGEGDIGHVTPGGQFRSSSLEIKKKLNEKLYETKLVETTYIHFSKIVWRVGDEKLSLCGTPI